MHKSFCWLLLVLPLLLAGCDKARVFEQNTTLPDNNWYVENVPVFEFQIQDTTQVYNLYFNVRYNLSYEFYNLYIRHQLFGPDGEKISSALHELTLMDAKTGKPLGKGSSNIFDMQALAIRDVSFQKAGTYRLRLTQYMRRDPLPNISAVGVRLEKRMEK